MNPLRTYQQEIYLSARQALAHDRSTCIQLATGGGKTPVMASMCESVFTKNKRAWIVVSRKELLTQASEHLTKWSVPHGIINADSDESRAFKIHVVSKDTLIRRYGKIKNYPDLLIFDECHLYLDRQIEIVSHLPDESKIIGMTATPERLDGRGLSELYDTLIQGPSIPDLTADGYLSPLRYFSPPIDGLQNLKVRGTEFDEEQLNELLERKKIYGELVGHYEKYGKGKPALIFCRSVKSAYQTAERFREKGFKFFCIEGNMSDKQRRELIAALTAGKIDGLTNCEIATYGLDIPRVEYGASIRPTLSRALYMQMIGRILRPFTDPVTGYKKQDAMFFDHVNLVLEHQDDNYPGVPLHYVPEIKWNFTGTKKRKRDKAEKNVKLCPYLDFMYCADPHCSTCQHNPDKSVQDVRKPMVVIDTDLTELTKPIKLNDRPPEERREIQDEIGGLILEYKSNPQPSIVEKLLSIAQALGYREMWVYHKLTPESQHTVNIPVLAEIARVKGYKPGWIYIARKKLQGAGHGNRQG